VAVPMIVTAQEIRFLNMSLSFVSVQSSDADGESNVVLECLNNF
jgi:hypothetical protein